MRSEDEEVGSHQRAGDECLRRHERTEDKLIRIVGEKIKTVMNKMTIRVGIIMFLSVALVTGIMRWVSAGEVVKHEKVEHKTLIDRPIMDGEHDKLEERISGEIDDLKDEMQDIGEKLDEYHDAQQNQYILILKEIQKLQIP